jgi:hypothetical protein
MSRGNRRQLLRFLRNVRGEARSRRALVSAALGAVALWGSDARADAPSSDEWLHVEGECPSAGRIKAELLRLVPPERRGVLEGARIVVRDQGDTYRVSVTSEVASAERRYDNPERECERRARFAAVFSVVTLLPPELGDESGTADEPFVSEPTPAKVNVPTPSREPTESVAADGAAPHEQDARDAEWGELTVGFGAVLAPESPRSPKMRGTPLYAQALLGGASWWGFVAAEFLPSTSFEFLDVRGELRRTSLYAGVRHWVLRDAVGLGVELGAVGSFDRVRGEGLVSVAEATTTFSVGARGRVAVEYPSAWRLRPYAAGQATWYPAAPALRLAPRGDVAELPTWWLGAEVGLAWGFN